MNKKVKTIVFISVEAILYIIGVFIKSNPWLLFSTVIIAFIYALISLEKGSEWLFLTFGLFFTVLADSFLVLWIGPMYIGMLFFIIVQSIYLYKIFRNETKLEGILHLSLSIGLILILIPISFIVFKENITAEIVEAVIYGTLLLLNLLFSLIHFKDNPLFAIGLILFVLCDINVMFEYLEGMGITLLYSLKAIPFNLVWFFYEPCLVCIALSEQKACD